MKLLFNTAIACIFSLGIQASTDGAEAEDRAYAPYQIPADKQALIDAHLNRYAPDDAIRQNVRDVLPFVISAEWRAHRIAPHVEKLVQIANLVDIGAFVQRSNQMFHGKLRHIAQREGGEGGLYELCRREFYESILGVNYTSVEQVGCLEAGLLHYFCLEAENFDPNSAYMQNVAYKVAYLSQDNYWQRFVLEAGPRPQSLEEANNTLETIYHRIINNRQV